MARHTKVQTREGAGRKEHLPWKNDVEKYTKRRKALFWYPSTLREAWKKSPPLKLRIYIQHFSLYLSAD